jgi:hypothetical protein
MNSHYKKIVAFDLDDVLCTRLPQYESLGVDKYLYCTPLINNINIVNELFLNGYKIIIYTARGMSHFDGNIAEIEKILRPITEKFLSDNNVSYHQLVFGKIHYDVLVDDKAINSNDVLTSEDVIRGLNGLTKVTEDIQK